MAKIVLEKTDDRLEVETSGSVREALDILENQEIDAVVSDYKMPWMDGLDFLKQVRKKNEDIPFIILTGRGDEDVAMGAANIGVDQYLKKKGKAREVFERLSQTIIQEVKRSREKPAEEHLIAWIEKKSYADLDLVKKDLKDLAEKVGFRIKKLEMHETPFKSRPGEPSDEIVRAYTETYEKVPNEKSEEAENWRRELFLDGNILDADVVVEGKREKDKTKTLKKYKSRERVLLD